MPHHDNSLLRTLAAAAAVALGYWLGFPGRNFCLPPLVLLVPAGLALLGAGAASGRQAFLRAWAAAFLGHILALSWLTVPLGQVGGLPLAAAVPCALLVCLVLATQGGLFALAARRFWRKDSFGTALALGLVWYFLELGYSLTADFPWLPLSGALIVWPWTLQAADTLGAALTASLWAAAALACAGGLIERRPRPICLGLLLAGLLGGYGLLALSLHPAIPVTGPDRAASALPRADMDEGDFPVLLVEGNIDQNQKWVEAYRRGTLETYGRLTLEALARARGALPPDSKILSRALVVWPETAMPFDLAGAPESRRLREIVLSAGLPLVTGAPGYDFGRDRRRRIYNRVWLLSGDGRAAGSYDKEHLVPFGEYVPSFFRWKFLEGLLQEVGAYSQGTRTEPLRTGGLALGPLVCYEAVFPWLAQERVAKGANLLLDVSNDGWFGDTAAPWQHQALTQLRALEQKRWLVRCTNTGISSVTDSRGRAVFLGPQFRTEALWAEARLESGHSLFHRLFFFLPAAAAVLLLLLLRFNRKTRNHAATE